jgi:hypothetical protein
LGQGCRMAVARGSRQARAVTFGTCPTGTHLYATDI